jgi:hypothetical protein
LFCGVQKLWYFLFNIFFLDLPNKPTATCTDIVHWIYETIIYNAWQWYWKGSLLVSLCLNQRKLFVFKIDQKSQLFQNLLPTLFEGLLIVLIRLDMKIYEKIWYIERLMAADREKYSTIKDRVECTPSLNMIGCLLIKWCNNTCLSSYTMTRTSYILMRG